MSSSTCAEDGASRREEWMQARMADLMADGAHGDDAYWQASGEWADFHADTAQEG